MNIYNAISDRVGWERQAVAFPTVDIVKGLLAQITEGNQDAYETVLRWHRFLPKAKGEEQQAVQDLVIEAWKVGRAKFY